MDLFFTINFSFGITTSIIGIIFSFLIFFVIIFDRHSHTINNLLICDISITGVIYFSFYLIGCVYGLREDWYYNQPLCSFRGYILIVSVTGASYSFLIQSISRLFFSVYYKYKFLLIWRTHWILIILKWFLSFLIPLQPFFIEGGYMLMEEYRMCGISIKILSIIIYSNITSFVFPATIVIMIYSKILYQVRQSTRRVASNLTGRSMSLHTSVPSVERNLKVMKNILLLMGIFMCGGSPFLILTLCNIIKPQSSPKQLYILSLNSILLCAAILMGVLFFTNKKVKDVIFRH
jgi:hypothetical protein